MSEIKKKILDIAKYLEDNFSAKILNFKEVSMPYNSYYVGDRKKTKRHGKGLAQYYNFHEFYKNNSKSELCIPSSIYIGEWQHNMREGVGMLIENEIMEGEILPSIGYIGQWKNDELHGQGALNRLGPEDDYNFFEKKLIDWVNTIYELDLFASYVGEWKNGKEHGKGRDTEYWDEKEVNTSGKAIHWENPGIWENGKLKEETDDFSEEWLKVVEKKQKSKQVNKTEKINFDTEIALHFLTTTDFDKLFADVNDDRPATEQELEHVFNVFINYFYKDKETGQEFIIKIKDIYESWAIKAYQEKYTARQYIKFLYAKFTAVLDHFKEGDLDEKIPLDEIYDFLKKEIN